MKRMAQGGEMPRSLKILRTNSSLISFVELGLVPPGVAAAFSQQSAAVLAQMAQYVLALQRASASSS